MDKRSELNRLAFDLKGLFWSATYVGFELAGDFAARVNAHVRRIPYMLRGVRTELHETCTPDGDSGYRIKTFPRI